MRIQLHTVEYDKWHTWYAWYPVVVENTIVWLDYVDRMITCGELDYYSDFTKHYRFISNPEGHEHHD